MNNVEWLNELVPEIGPGIKTAVMTVRGVEPLAAYNGDSLIELAEADLYMRMLIMPEFSEGSLSIKYSASSLKAAANRIYLKYNDPHYDAGGANYKKGKIVIKRYPHTATIRIETLSGGPIPEVTTETIETPGRYEPNSQNNSLNYSAKFYCPILDILKEDPNALDGKKMFVMGREIGISTAWNYQIHCEIWLD